MKYIALINEIINYIEENLYKPISVEELANRFFISKYYLIRIFKAVTNYTLKDYIDKRRLTEAANKLIRDKGNVVDTAFEFGFNSHETFTRQFKRVFNMTPIEIKKKNSPIVGYEKIVIVERDFKNLNKNLVADFTLVSSKEIRLYGKSTGFDPLDEYSLRKLTPFVEEFVTHYIDKRDVTRMYNVVTSESDIGPFGYFAGFCYEEPIDEVGIHEIRIPETNYAVFKYKVDLTDIHKTVTNDISRSIVISELTFNKIGVEFFVVFEKDYFETYEYKVYVPVK